MTTPAQPGPDGLPPEWPAGHADGELATPARDAVERWLADHPEAQPDIQGQRDLSPQNSQLWDRAEPPEPSLAAWADVRRGIEDALDAADSPRPNHGRGWRVAAWVFGGLTVGAAAAIAWLAFGPVAELPVPGKPAEIVKVPPEVAPAPHPVPVALAVAPAPRVVQSVEVAALPMASDDDVILDRVPALADGWLPIGRHPLAGMLVLATVDEVHLEEVEPCPAWPAGMPKMTRAAGDAPMIFAAKPR